MNFIKPGGFIIYLFARFYAKSSSQTSQSPVQSNLYFINSYKTNKFIYNTLKLYGRNRLLMVFVAKECNRPRMHLMEFNCDTCDDPMTKVKNYEVGTRNILKISNSLCTKISLWRSGRFFMYNLFLESITVTLWDFK